MHSPSHALSLLALSLALGGCSIIHHANTDRLRDAGADGYAPDMFAADAGPETGPTDGGPDAFRCPNTREISCNNGIDDDCNGLTDCADPQCVASTQAACCAPGAVTNTEQFMVNTAGVWTTASSWNAPASMVNAIDASGALSRMGTGALVGMVETACLHIDLGTEIRFTMQAMPCTGTECDGRMEVVLGPSATFGGSLNDDLAIRGVVTAPGLLRLEVVQGGTVRQSSHMLFGSAVTTVRIRLSPGIADGHPAMVATVVATTAGPMPLMETIGSNLRVTDRDVFGTSSCHGLRLGVQGTGTHVALDDIGVTQLDCANPARFDALRDDALAIDAVTTSVSSADHAMGWGRGGIGDPALLEGVIGTTHTFMLMFDGSPSDRANDVVGHLPLSIGGADTTETSGPSNLVLVNDCSRWMPRGGAIACMPPSMASGRDLIESPLVMRDPTFYPESRDPRHVGSLRVAWVGETAGASPLVLYTSTLDPSTSSRLAGIPSPTTINGEDTTACPSIRNPLLLPIVGSLTQWLLFYVCDTFPPVVHAATMDTSASTTTRFRTFELGPTQLGALAQQGVTDIAGVVFVYGGTPTYRLWLTARPTTSTSAVLFVEGRLTTPGAPPTFVPFAGNPVLTSRSPVFGSCGSGCQLHGITATRISDQPTRVRLLIERWVDTGAGLQYGLVPLEQIWPADG